MVVLICAEERRKGDNQERRWGQKKRPGERGKVMEGLGLRLTRVISSSEFDPESSWKQVS